MLVFHSTFRAVVHPCWAFKAISLVLVFRAIIPFQLGVQSHRVFSFTMFKVVFLNMTFLVTSLVGHAELLFQIGIHRCFFWFGIQSRHFISAFRGLVISFWCSESLIISQLDVQSHHVFSPITLGVIFLSLTLIVIGFSLAFKSTSSFGIQSHVMFHLAFRATIHSRFTTFGVTMPHF